jgi:tripartite-type tricarboxylate transporter receptor subunit TctC
LVIALCAASLVHTVAALAATFPDKPINIIVPYAVGGTTDIIVRILQEPMQKLLGQTLVIQARPGASGMIATRSVARAPADGYTLLMQTNGLIISPNIYKDAGYAALEDFEPIVLLASQPFVLASNSSLPVRSVKELIDYAKANPGRVKFGSSGPASYGRIATELFMQQAGITMTHIPYKGVADINMALLRGEVDIMLSATSPQFTDYVKEGKVNLLGVASLEPSPLLPGVEPIAKTLDGYHAEVWYGLLAPRATPREVITKVQQAAAQALARTDVKAALDVAGATAEPAMSEQFKARIEQEYRVWETVVRKAGIAQ